MAFDDGTLGKYNIGHERAERYWNMHKDYFNSFDIILTSDTCPISRVFLQNNFQKKLVIWICNRFNYYCYSTLDCNFPDDEYYDLIRSIKDRPNVTIAGNCAFENFYARRFYNTDVGDLVINPIGKISSVYSDYEETPINKKEYMWIPQYHNETQFMNLSEKLTSLNILNYNKRHGGLNDLKDFKGIVCIPYAWSTIAFYESIQLGMVYFIPTMDFFFKLKDQGNFWFQSPCERSLLHLSEWYSDENKALFVFFDSWEDLKIKIDSTNYEEKKEYILNFSKIHEAKQLALWKNVLLS
jgi:hypothetical protein